MRLSRSLSCAVGGGVDLRRMVIGWVCVLPFHWVTSVVCDEALGRVALWHFGPCSRRCVCGFVAAQVWSLGVAPVAAESEHCVRLVVNRVSCCLNNRMLVGTCTCATYPVFECIASDA